jgi:hypothetical protein
LQTFSDQFRKPTLILSERFDSKHADVRIDPVGKNSTIISAAPNKLMFGLKIENSIKMALV